MRKTRHLCLENGGSQGIFALIQGDPGDPHLRSPLIGDIFKVSVDSVQKQTLLLKYALYSTLKIKKTEVYQAVISVDFFGIWSRLSARSLNNILNLLRKAKKDLYRKAQNTMIFNPTIESSGASAM